MNIVAFQFTSQPSEQDGLNDIAKQPVGYRLQIFDPQIDEINRELEFLNFMMYWQTGRKDSSITPLTVLGFKATDRGLLKCSPTIPPHESIAFVVEKRDWMKDVRAQRSRTTKSNRMKSNFDLDYDSYKTDFEGVASHAGAITPFHMDSMMSGAYIFQFFGIKVVCSCPLNDHNWEVFKRHHLKSDPNAG